jgi:hypothetical protein
MTYLAHYTRLAYHNWTAYLRHDLFENPLAPFCHPEFKANVG